MIVQGHRQSGFKTDVLRTRGWYALRGFRGLGQSLPNFSPGQWYELIALVENQPLADVQAYYSQTAAGSNISNLAVALGQWPGGIAHSGYLQYQSGGVVDAPAGSGHYFQYAGGYVNWAKANSVNPWAIPAQAPTAQQIATQQAASTAQYQQAMAAPVYSQPQNPAAVIAAYNAANPQAPVALSAPAPTAVSSVAPTVLPIAAPVVAPAPPAPAQKVISPSPASQSTSTGTAATSSTSAVSVANGQTATTTSTVNQGTTSTGLDLTSLFGGTEWISGIPNIVLILGGGVLLAMLLAGGKGR